MKKEQSSIATFIGSLMVIVSIALAVKLIFGWLGLELWGLLVLAVNGYVLKHGDND